MKGWLLLFVLLPASAQAQPAASTGMAVAWDFDNVALTEQLITHFEICFDTVTPCPFITPAGSQFIETQPPGTPAGASAYQFLLPSFAFGSTHTVTVKACNASACGPASPPFVFRWVLPPPTAIPQRLRVRSGG